MADINTASGIKERAEVDLGLASDAYTDAQWVSLTERAVSRINRKLNLSGQDSEITLSAGTYTRSDSGAITDSIGDIVLLQVECIVAKTLRRSAVSKGIRVKDGDSSIDTTAGFDGHAGVVDDICGELNQAIIDYKTQDPDGEAGAASFGKLITYDNSEIIIDVDHNGQTSTQRDYRSPFDPNNEGLNNYPG
jgi:hypothetical protein